MKVKKPFSKAVYEGLLALEQVSHVNRPQPRRRAASMKPGPDLSSLRGIFENSDLVNATPTQGMIYKPLLSDAEKGPQSNEIEVHRISPRLIKDIFERCGRGESIKLVNFQSASASGGQKKIYAQLWSPDLPIETVGRPINCAKISTMPFITEAQSVFSLHKIIAILTQADFELMPWQKAALHL